MKLKSKCLIDLFSEADKDLLIETIMEKPIQLQKLNIDYQSKVNELKQETIKKHYGIYQFYRSELNKLRIEYYKKKRFIDIT